MNERSLDPTTTSSPAGDRATEFVAVDAHSEQYSGEKLLVTAYVFVWLILMGWIFVLWQKQQKLGRQLGELEAVVARTTKAGAHEAHTPSAKNAANANAT